MSASVLLAIPFALFAIVLLLCFVGCGFEHGQLAGGFTTYTSSILAEPTLVAYWPLGEAGGTTAFELKGPRNGTYLSQFFPADPLIGSAESANPPVLSLGEQGLLDGDRVPPANTDRTTCIKVDGGYVSVDFDAALNPTQADGFTIEAWVRVGWDEASTAAIRVIMVSFDITAGNHGYGLLATRTNTWQGQVGTGSGITTTTTDPANDPPIMLGMTSHVVLTYDGSLLTLFVNGSQAAQVTTDYQPAQSRLFIGAGAPFFPEPRFPWVGNIQCVAIYKGALSPEQVATHTAHGNGMFVDGQ